MTYTPYPFDLLRTLLKDIRPKASELNLSIGQSRLPMPSIIEDAVRENLDSLDAYPVTLAALKSSIASYVNHEFDIEIDTACITPTMGLKEALFSLPKFIIDTYIKDKIAYEVLKGAPMRQPCVAMGDPFYKVYEGASINANAKIIYLDDLGPLLNAMCTDIATSLASLASLDGTKDTNGPLSLDVGELANKLLGKIDILILNSPNNPTGATIDSAALVGLIYLARMYDFYIIADECYIGIYEGAYKEGRAPSLLEAALYIDGLRGASSGKAGMLDALYTGGTSHALASVGLSVMDLDASFSHIYILNSLSKIACAPGLRAGYVISDAKALRLYETYRSYIGVNIPYPLQRGAIAGWGAHKQREELRELYANNARLGHEILGEKGVFYLWLDVSRYERYADKDIEATKDAVRPSLQGEDNPLSLGELACKEIYSELGIKTLPGRYMSHQNTSDNYLRIALVYPGPVMERALRALRDFLGKRIER